MIEQQIECEWKYISNYERAHDIVEGRGLSGTRAYEGKCYDCPGHDNCGAYYPNEDRRREGKR